MFLIDTSLWIEFLRNKGNPVHQQRVETLLVEGNARIAAPVLIELWNGVKGKEERSRISAIQDAVPELKCTDEVFALSYQMADRARGAGLSIPAIDILIFSIARFYGARLESLDLHFKKLDEKIGGID